MFCSMINDLFLWKGFGSNLFWKLELCQISRKIASDGTLNNRKLIFLKKDNKNPTILLRWIVGFWSTIYLFINQTINQSINISIINLTICIYLLSINSKICLPVNLSIYQPFYISIYLLFICLSVYLSIYLCPGEK